MSLKVTCDGCGKASEEMMPKGWLVNRLEGQNGHPMHVEVIHGCSMSCLVKSLRKLADQKEAALPR